MHKAFILVAAAGVTGLIGLHADAAPLPKPDAGSATILVAEPGQADRGGDGGSLPELPGGQGGRSGVAGGSSRDDGDDDRYNRWGSGYHHSLASYCEALGKRWRWWRWWRGPVTSDRYDPSDCDGYWASRTQTARHRGADGPSIAGGEGGRGGRSGEGPDGGSSGAGGTGFAGSVGGKGGAGGAGY